MIDVRVENERASKADFIDELCNFYMNVSDNYLGITGMHYVESTYGEYVYVDFNDSQKKFCVSCDSKDAMLNDFTRFVSNFKEFPWLRKEERV